MKKTVIIGASENPSRYSYMAAKRLLSHGHEIVMIGNREGEIEGNKILKSRPEAKDIDTITLYINSKIQKEYYEYIIGLKPKRIIFNPGAENEELENLAAKNDIETIEACTLVMLSIGNF